MADSVASARNGKGLSRDVKGVLYRDCSLLRFLSVLLFLFPLSEKGLLAFLLAQPTPPLPLCQDRLSILKHLMASCKK
jgi:hypothetical protein